MDERTTNNLYRLLPFMFKMQLFGAGLVFLVFLFYGMFAGGFDLTGDEVLGLPVVLIGLPLAFILTLLTYMIYPYPKSLSPWLLIFTTVFNALLSIPLVIMMFSLFLALIDVLFY